MRSDKDGTMDTLTGSIELIRFQRDEFVILVINPDEGGRRVSCLGSMMSPTIGLTYTFFGKASTDSKWGPQFKFSSYKTEEPTDPVGLVRYLIKACRWIGATVASRIVDQFQADTLKVLKTDPAMVAQKIKGITLDRAKDIQETLTANEALEAVMVALESMLDVPGVRKATISSLIKDFGGAAADKLRQNFYILTNYHGTGFILADKVAIKNGVDWRDIERQKAAVMYVIGEGMAKAGDVWFEDKWLRDQVKGLIHIDAGEGIDTLQGDRKIVKRNGLWATRRAADREMFIARKMMEFIPVENEMEGIHVCA